jgi:uncharacterized membrane protein (UPF0127 family)
VRRWIRLAGLPVAVLLLAACGGTTARQLTPPAFATSAAGLPTTALTTADRTITVEVAADTPARELGLGGRDGLPADAGMLFDLQQPATASFWMKGMRFALDMVWIDDAKRIVATARDVQPQPGAPDSALTLYHSPSPVRYVVEVNAGAADRLGLTDGTTVRFELPARNVTPAAAR